MAREKWYEKEIETMLAAVLAAKDKKQLTELFDRILTPREINDMSRRLAAGKMLAEGISYNEIREKLNLSPVIIARVSNRIGYGFRRSAGVVKEKEAKYREPKKIIKYKGATPIHRLISGK